jgi:hypothetical protein
MGTPNSLRIMYKTSLLTESYASSKSMNSQWTVSLHCQFLHYLTNAIEWSVVDLLRQNSRRGRAVSRATGYGLKDLGVGFRVPVGLIIFHVVKTGSGVHPTSYPIGTGGIFPEGKAAEAWSWQLISNQCGVKKTRVYSSTPPSIRLLDVVLS